jgi:GDP-mannose pyrophosphatase NudK
VERHRAISSFCGLTTQSYARSMPKFNRPFNMPFMEVLSSTRVYDGWSKLDELEVRLPDGKSQRRIVFDSGDSAAVLLHNVDAEELIFVKQTRLAARQRGVEDLIEIVAGRVDEGESPGDAAVRESEEEVGLRLEGLQQLAEVFPSPGACAERITIFYGKVGHSSAVSSGGGVDAGEDIEYVRLPVKEAFDMLDKGEIVDAKTLIALQWLRLRR